MEEIDLNQARDQLEALIVRAQAGEDVRISDPKVGTVRLMPVPKAGRAPKRVTDTMPPFVPLDKPRVPGRWAGRLPPPPNDFFDPLSEEELKDWYGDDA